MTLIIRSIDVYAGEVGAEGDAYNLQRIRSSTLGQSAPSLTANSVVSVVMENLSSHYFLLLLLKRITGVSDLCSKGSFVYHLCKRTCGANEFPF